MTKIPSFIFIALLIFSLTANSLSANSSQPKIDPAFATAVKENNLPLVKTLFAAGFNADSLVTDNLSALCYATMYNYIELANIFLAKQETPSSQCFALAVANNHLQLVQSYLQAGVKLNEPLDIEGNSALHIAVRMNYLEMVKILLDNDADTKLKNKKGLTVNDMVQAEKQRILDIEEALNKQ